MSNRYKGAVISATPPTTTGGNDGVASGAWTLEQQMQAQAAGLWPNQPIFYIEDVFSTYLYTGNGSSQTITNGINLSGKGGLVWIKSRTSANSNSLVDSATSSNGRYYLISNLTNGLEDTGTSTFPFTTSGFSLTSGANQWNGSQNYVSWTFREQAKFFDIVTYTGTGVARTVAHSLGSVPGCMIVKKTSAVADWQVYHQSTAGGMGPSKYMVLNSTAAESSGSDRWNNTAPTSTVFTVGNAPETNDSGATYVAYLFAHDAGGFGLTGTDNVISCGSYTGNGSTTGPIITLGYEPQWLMIKRTSSTGSWYIFDSMRGLRNSGGVWLLADTSDAENTSVNIISSLATGFQPVQTGTATNGSGDTYIYIAIRRGPMRVPTSGTSVFSPVARAGTSATATVTTNFVTDSVWSKVRNNTGGIDGAFYDRLRGVTFLVPNTTGAELSNGGLSNFANNTGYNLNSDGGTLTINSSSYNYGNWAFKRAPSFFDEVCFTYANTTNERITHNLGVAPEFIIVKSRSDVSAWPCYISTSALSSGGIDKYIYLSQGNQLNTNTNTWGTSNPTATDFGMSPSLFFSAGQKLVAYLFATCAGVSKVGSYTGTGTTQTINCGFTGGARFVLIKQTLPNATGWTVFDTARGMVSGTDPYLLLNSTAAENNADNVYSVAGGFQLVSAAGVTNDSGGTYIFLAIA